eukprot:scaffold12187_cov34-Phaeocystis_antarctica.AAC.1
MVTARSWGKNCSARSIGHDGRCPSSQAGVHLTHDLPNLALHLGGIGHLVVALWCCCGSLVEVSVLLASS